MKSLSSSLSRKEGVLEFELYRKHELQIPHCLYFHYASICYLVSGAIIQDKSFLKRLVETWRRKWPMLERRSIEWPARKSFEELSYSTSLYCKMNKSAIFMIFNYRIDQYMTYYCRHQGIDFCYCTPWRGQAIIFQIEEWDIVLSWYAEKGSKKLKFML